jgi:hypothetical protein
VIDTTWSRLCVVCTVPPVTCGEPGLVVADVDFVVGHEPQFTPVDA